MHANGCRQNAAECISKRQDNDGDHAERRGARARAREKTGNPSLIQFRYYYL